MTQERRAHRKTRTGVVTSDRMDKTVVVAVTRAYQHPLYKKIVRDTTKILAHDEENTCALGDVVQVIESRPLSRRKKWRVRRITTKAQSGDSRES